MSAVSMFRDNLGVWEAYNDPGSPLSVANMDNCGLSVTLYHDEEGIYGIDIFEAEGELVAAYGYKAEGEVDSE